MTGYFGCYGPETAVVCLTPNGREIRRTRRGTYEVQPQNDNVWVECETLEDAYHAYDPAWDGPDGD